GGGIASPRVSAPRERSARVERSAGASRLRGSVPSFARGGAHGGRVGGDFPGQFRPSAGRNGGLMRPVRAAGVPDSTANLPTGAIAPETGKNRDFASSRRWACVDCLLAST